MKPSENHTFRLAWYEKSRMDLFRPSLISAKAVANVDMQVGRCRLISNQRGYPREGLAAYRPDLVIEA